MGSRSVLERVGFLAETKNCITSEGRGTSTLHTNPCHTSSRAARLHLRLIPTRYNCRPITGACSETSCHTGVQLRRRIDGTVLIVDDNNYFVWSCQRELASLGKTVQSICIARMTSPTQLDTSTVGILSQPDQPWEQSNIATEPAVNERVEMFDLKGCN